MEGLKIYWPILWITKKIISFSYLPSEAESRIHLLMNAFISLAIHLLGIERHMIYIQFQPSGSFSLPLHSAK